MVIDDKSRYGKTQGDTDREAAELSTFIIK